MADTVSAKNSGTLSCLPPHNLLGDPPFSRVHLITCRNLLIYLDRSVQRDVIDLFHYALCPDGYLLLGSAETIEASDLFRTEDKRLCLYRKKNVPAPEPRLPVFPFTRLRVAGEPVPRPELFHEAVPYSAVHQTLLERYAPPSILVGADNRLVHLSEHAGRYLVHPGGDVTLSVVKLVREELRIELRALLQAARETKEPQDSRPIPVQFNGHQKSVMMHVRPSADPEQDGFSLVVFTEFQHEVRPPMVGKAAAQPEGEERGRVDEIEAELGLTRQRLQAVIEEYETSREEMKAANEEMQSSNEELRSTMEELETSKEELQSINEELQTVNQENRHKVEELSQLSSDLQNLLAATEIATLFLDRELRILRFTPKVAELFNVRVTDRGRPISDLTHRLGYQELRGDAEIVLGRLIPVEREIQDDAGRWYLTRVLPYRSTEDRIEGVVITFIDITTQKRAEMALRESDDQLRRSLAEKEELLKEVHHRVKNNLQIITSLLNLQAKRIQDKASLDFFEEARNRVQSIAAIHEIIYRSESFAAVELGTYLRRLVPEIVRLYGAHDRIEVVLQADSTSMELHRAVPFGLLLNELVSNVCKHAFPGTDRGRLTVRLVQEHSDLILTVEDTGVGLTEKFEYETADSLGIYLVRSLARQLRADVTFDSSAGTGVRVRLPQQPPSTPDSR